MAARSRVVPIPRCRVHGRALTYNLVGVLRCRACEHDASRTQPAISRQLAAQLGRVPEPSGEDRTA